MRKLYQNLTVITCTFLWGISSLWGQATVSCPSNITVNAANGQCGANVSYSAPSASCSGGGTTTVTFNYTGAVQTWVVPPGVTSVSIQCYGAQGRSNQASILGGKGGYSTGTRAVTPGSTVYVNVGGGGGISTAGGFNGGGNAGTSPCTQALGGGGGGASDVRVGGSALGNRVIVAGGGGGAGGQRLINCGRGTGGGGGGGYYGGGGGAGWPGIPPGGPVPTGGTQSGGGSGGVTTWTGGGPTNGAAGTLGNGGKGGDEESSAQFGSATAQPGGYGGGTTGQNGLYNSANDWTGQSGAGGSGYIGGVTGGSMLSNNRSGNGLVTITYTVVYTPTVTQTGGGSSGAFFPVGSTTNAFTASCPVGSNSSCSFTVTVIDNQNPTITCPANMTVNAASGQCSAVVTYSVTSTDNCPGQTVSKTAGLNSGATFPVGTTSNSYKVTDASGKTATCSFNVTVVDNQNPTITCPSNITANAASGSCTANVTYSVTSADNCPGQTVSKTAGLNSGAAFPVGSTTNTYTVTDAYGHVASCSFTVTVVDNQNPTITCPANITANAASGQCSANVTYSVSSADNCVGASQSQTAGLASGAAFPVGTTTNSFKVTDASGHIATCSFSVTVVDNQNPTVTCPANMTVNNTSGQCSATVTYALSSADNCPGQTVSQSAGLPSLATFPVGTTTNSFVVTDGAGHTSTCSFNITVVDNQNPTITCPANMTVNATSGQCSAPVTYSVTSADNCPGQTISKTAGLSSGATFPVGTTSNTWKATDAAGNIANCTFTVTVVDNQNPTITCPSNISVNASSGGCTANVTYSISSADNCPGQTVSQGGGMASGAAFPTGTTTNTFTVTDASGNTATCSFTVSVTDNQNPTITCPANITVNATSGQCSAPVSYSVTSADNCVGASQAQTGGLASGAAFPVGTTTNAFTVTDAASNTASCSFSVTVIDNQNPTITCPSNITVNNATGQCAANVTYSVSTADNCPGQALSQSAGLASSASFPVGTTTNSFLVTDASGNTANCSFNVTVVDNQNPTITCPANISITPNANNCSPAVTWTTPVSGDNCGVTTSNQTHTSGSSFSPGTTTVTYTVGDAAGNTSSCSFTVSIVPTPLVLSLTPSVFNCGTNLSCNGDNSGSLSVTATGGCEPYSYSWSNGPTTSSITGLSAQKYVVTVTDNNGTVKKDSLTLTEPTPLTGSINAPPGVCGPLGTTGFTDLTVSGGSNCQAYSYSWTGPGSFTASTEDLSNLPAGIYSVVATDANGCTYNGSVNIVLFQLPVANLGADSTICDGSTHILNPGSFSGYLWQNNSTAATLPVTSAGLYWSEVTDANGCQDRDSIVISVHTVAPTTHTYSETVPLCQNDTAVITANSGYSSYLWAGPVVIGTIFTNDNVPVTSPGGAITLTVSDATGCARTDTIVVPFVNQPDPNPSITPDPGILCPGGQDTLDAGAGYTTYAWSTGATTRTIIVNTAGSYSVEVTNSFGCGEADDVAAINVPAPVPVITQSNDTLYCQTGFASYQWAINGTPLAFATNSFYVPPVTGQYSVTVVDGNGCVGTATFDVTVGVEENADFAGLEVFPNPTEGYLNIRPFTPIGKKVEIRVFDMYGKIIRQFGLDNLTHDVTLNLTDLSKGVYVLTISTDNSSFVRKIILE
ncbi:MAG: HYR domain-containing protein [Bacteroidia bacterium]|nr:HYR domain-containing protein [Bacteroidia bacterium]